MNRLDILSNILSFPAILVSFRRYMDRVLRFKFLLVPSENRIISKITFFKHVSYSDYNPKVRYLHALIC